MHKIVDLESGVVLIKPVLIALDKMGVQKNTIVFLFCHEYATVNTVFESSNSVVFRLQPGYFLSTIFKAYVVGTHLNCIDLSMQFK